MTEDDAKKPRKIHEIGENLDMLSVAELDERIGALRAEIARLEGAKGAKSSHRSAADALFR